MDIFGFSMRASCRLRHCHSLTVFKTECHRAVQIHMQSFDYGCLDGFDCCQERSEQSTKLYFRRVYAYRWFWINLHSMPSWNMVGKCQFHSNQLSR
jgi:hypothetical protein